MKYFASLSAGRTVLWCYLIWYVFFAARYFDPSRNLWLTSLGISGVIGIALFLSTNGANSQLDRWQVFRLFLMPFCVSSFSSLIKGRGFVLIVPPVTSQIVISVSSCVIFVLAVYLVKRLRRGKYA